MPLERIWSERLYHISVIMVFIINRFHILGLIWNFVQIWRFPVLLSRITVTSSSLGLALLTLSWDKNWDSHSLVNGYPSFYPRIALVAPSPGDTSTKLGIVPCSALYGRQGVRSIAKHREFGITNWKASAQSSLKMFFFQSAPDGLRVGIYQIRKFVEFLISFLFSLGIRVS